MGVTEIMGKIKGLWMMVGMVVKMGGPYQLLGFEMWQPAYGARLSIISRILRGIAGRLCVSKVAPFL